MSILSGSIKEPYGREGFVSLEIGPMEIIFSRIIGSQIPNLLMAWQIVMAKNFDGDSLIIKRDLLKHGIFYVISIIKLKP